MFKLVWAFGFIINGAPQIQKMQDPAAPMRIEECMGTVIMHTDRMADWVRGVLRQSLEFPVAVHGECEPVQQDATQRTD
jgi:hypothetical protein